MIDTLTTMTASRLYLYKKKYEKISAKAVISVGWDDGSLSCKQEDLSMTPRI